MPPRSEEELLRSAALQTARSIFQARELAETALRAQSEWLRITLSSIADGVISTDADGRVTFLNGVAEALTGWSLDEASGRPLQEVFRITTEDDGSEVENPALQALREGRKVELAKDSLLVARDGYRRPIDDSAAPMRDGEGKVIGAVLVFRDMTERRRDQRERERLQREVAVGSERLRLLVDNATDYAVIIMDADSRILEWSGGAQQIMGWSEQEIVGQPADIIFTPEDRTAGAADLERAKAVATGRAEDKRWHLRKDGSRFFGDGVMTSLRDPDGRLQGFGKIVRDATDRKRAEETLREADRRKDEFIALLAHELRNPLAPIRNGLQVMRLAGADASAVAQARAIMERQLGHMVRLIDDLLDVSRISQNKMELRREHVLLSDVVSHAVETARPTIEAAGHQLTVSLPPMPVFLDADLTRIAQVLSNLLTNSAKYTEAGGRIWLSGERQGDAVLISVRDTGIGIPNEALPHVFDMFSQVDRTTERSTGGLGIGLALVKGLVEMHGGTVAARSDGLGSGSTFTVRLPALRTINEALVAPPDSPAAGADRARRILIVDDNEDSAATMERVLTLLGHHVRAAHDGVEAIATAEQFRPEVILMDVGMPRMDGYEATRRIRAQDWGRDILIVALTGWGQDADRVQSREAGCDGHLVKPVDLGDLERLLQALDQG